MRYLLLLFILSCAPKHKPLETEGTTYEVEDAVLEMFDDEDAFEDLPEAGEDEEE
tara:strand:+ start:243 stop:407 length:165 start_codon:yes stop_codon:yes gene_type:complete